MQHERADSGASARPVHRLERSCIPVNRMIGRAKVTALFSEAEGSDQNV
jgi:hypothetical protein